MFEIELFICLKMDLVSNNLQWLICHKTKPNKFMSQAECDIRLIFKWSTTGLNPKFSFSYTGCLMKAKQLTALLFIYCWKLGRDGFLPFPRALTQSEMQKNLSKIWILITDSIFYYCYNKQVSKCKISCFIIKF